LGVEELLEEPKGAALPPGHFDRFVEESRGENDREVSSAMEPQRNFVVCDGDVGRHVDQIAEDLACLRVAISAHAPGHEAIET